MIHKVRKLEILMIIVHVGEGKYWILFCNLKKITSHRQRAACTSIVTTSQLRLTYLLHGAESL